MQVRRDLIFAYHSAAQGTTASESNTHANGFLLDYAVVPFFHEDVLHFLIRLSIHPETKSVNPIERMGGPQNEQMPIALLTCTT
jgi:hypothetical protein